MWQPSPETATDFVAHRFPWLGFLFKLRLLRSAQASAGRR